MVDHTSCSDPGCGCGSPTHMGAVERSGDRTGSPGGGPGGEGVSVGEHHHHIDDGTPVYHLHEFDHDHDDRPACYDNHDLIGTFNYAAKLTVSSNLAIR